MGNSCKGKLEEYSNTLDTIERDAQTTWRLVEEVRQLRMEVSDQHRRELQEKVKITQNDTLSHIKKQFAHLEKHIPSMHRATFDSGAEVLANIISSKSIKGDISPKDLGFNMPDQESRHIHQLIKANKVKVIQQKINRTGGVIKVLLKLKNLTSERLTVKVLPGDTWVAPGGKIQPGINATTKTIDLLSYGTSEKIITCYCGNSSVAYPGSNPTIVKLCNLQWGMPNLDELGIFNFTADEYNELKQYEEIQRKIREKFEKLIDLAIKIDNEISMW